MNELFKFWLYIYLVYREYRRDHGNVSRKVGAYEDIIYQYYRYICDEFHNKYEGRQVRHLNGNIGIIRNMYNDHPCITVEFDDDNIMYCSIKDVELI